MTWLWLALAVLVIGPARQRASTAAGSRLDVLGAVAVFVASVVLAGPVAGVVIGAVLAICLRPALRWLEGRAALAPDPALPLALDLAAASLHAGQPVGAALRAAAEIAGARSAEAFTRVARLLELGSPAADAWRGADGPLASVAQAACRSATSGARLAAAFSDSADDLRAAAHLRGQAAAHRAGVLAMVPLGLCFLPAFACLGVVPVIAGLTDSVVGVTP